MELEVQSKGSRHVCLKGTESSGRLGPGCQERRWHQGATCPQRTRVWASQTRAFPLLLLNLMDIRNKTFLIIVVFDSLEIFNQEPFAGTSILSPPNQGKGLQVCLEWPQRRAPLPLGGGEVTTAQQGPRTGCSLGVQLLL